MTVGIVTWIESDGPTVIVIINIIVTSIVTIKGMFNEKVTNEVRSVTWIESDGLVVKVIIINIILITITVNITAMFNKKVTSEVRCEA